jgi:tetratricopeptide (TPR) repeat protein
MTVLSVWALHYGIIVAQRSKSTVTHSKSGNDTKKYFADAWYNYGLKAWYENDLNLAADYFRNAVGVNVLHVDAWLKLAQVETGIGNTETAGDILKFTNDLTRQVVRWKWSQLLLARELKLDDIFWENINFVIPYPQFQNDALHLSDLHLGSDIEAALNVLESRNLPYYLRWLMTWNRTEDTFRVWRFIEENQLVDNDLYDRYIHFLISQKEIRRASEIRKKYTGIDGMTNPGFELPLSNKGFGWRGRTGAHWDIQRVGSGAIRGIMPFRWFFPERKTLTFSI